MPAGIKTRSPRASRSPQLVEVPDLTAGLDVRRSPTLLQSNRARTLRNMSLEEPGALMPRRGYQAASSVVWFAGAPQGGQRVYLSNGAFNLIAGGGKVYKPSDAWAGSTAAVYSSVSPTNQVYFPHDRDLVMVMDGANRPRFSTNGTDWNLSGIDAPSSAATVSSASSGALSSGEYAVAYTYKHRGTAHESNVSAESTRTITGSTGALSVTASPSTDPKVDAYVWYARHKTPDLESVLRKVSSGAASTFTITSSAWTSNDEAPTNHNVPLALAFGAIWKSRWWAKDAVVGNRLRFTELFQPQSWPSLYYIDIPFEKGDSITALMPLGDTLLVFGQSGVFLVIGQTSLDFEVRPSQGGETGAFGHRAVSKVEQAVMHGGGDGLNSFDGAADRSLEHDISAIWTDLTKNSPSADLALTAMVYDHPRQEVRVSVPRVYPTATRGEVVLHLDRTRENEGSPAWATTDRDVAFYMLWDGNEATAGNRGRLFSMPNTSGVVFEENVEDVGANSTNLTAEYEGPALSFGLHRTRVIGTYLEFEPKAGALSMELVVDGVSMGSQTVDISGGLQPYGSTTTYGTASRTYGGVARRKSPLLTWPIEAHGHTAVTKLAYAGLGRPRLYTYSHLVLPETAPRNL